MNEIFKDIFKVYNILIKWVWDICFYLFLFKWLRNLKIKDFINVYLLIYESFNLLILINISLFLENFC